MGEWEAQSPEGIGSAYGNESLSVGRATARDWRVMNAFLG